MGANATVSLKTITKNNNIKLDGLTIRMGEEKISPTIYLNDYYKQYKVEKCMEKVVESVISIYKDNRLNNVVDVDFFTDYSNIEERIVMKLIHYKENEEFLETLPHIRYLDLAIVFYCLLKSEILGNATILIHQSHMNMWEKTKEDLYQMALRNTPKLLSVQIDNIETILQKELGEELEDMMEWDVQEPSLPMYVISNQEKINGAACILYQDVLKDFASVLKSDLYILPSSIHEVIVIPKKNDTDPYDLKQIVKETNDNHVEREDILSYSVYEYSRKGGEVLQIL
jgi:hypothetical protein